MSITTRINELLEQGLTTTKIKAFLTIEDYSPKDIANAFKELGLTGSKPKTFASEYYNWLALKQRSTNDAIDYINGLGEYGETTTNVQKHKSHYLNIAELSATIWNAKTPEEDDIQVRAAFDKLNKAKQAWADGGKKPRKATFHPDKISSLDNDELTEAYTAFFKELS